ncbi:MAG: SWF/SNF helicase family protein [Saprospiraceae bacterium]|nr:SWF/SNF helicase family protein [Saprospiraceae bacterium]
MLGESGKFDDIIITLEKVVQRGMKVLVFSSFVQYLDLVGEKLNELNIHYLSLTGSDSQSSRKQAVNRFQNELACHRTHLWHLQKDKSQMLTSNQDLTRNDFRNELSMGYRLYDSKNQRKSIHRIPDRRIGLQSHEISIRKRHKLVAKKAQEALFLYF